MEVNRLIIHPLILAAFLVMVTGSVTGAAVAPEVNMEPVGHFGGITEAVEVAGNYAYVGQGLELLILDITNPSSPVPVGKIMTKGLVSGIKVSGNYAYVGDSENGFLIVDVSNPSSPFIKGRYAGPAWDVAVSGNYIYVSEGVNGFSILKANPEQPALLVANFISNVTSGNVPLSVQFNDSSVNATAWNWDFGDGFSSTNQNPVHTYSSAGAYIVNLIVINTNKTASKETTIYVMKTTGSNEESSAGSDGKAGGIVTSTKETSTPAKGSKKIPGFEIVYGVVSLLATFCIKESNKGS